MNRVGIVIFYDAVNLGGQSSYAFVSLLRGKSPDFFAGGLSFHGNPDALLHKPSADRP